MGIGKGKCIVGRVEETSDTRDLNINWVNILMPAALMYGTEENKDKHCDYFELCYVENVRLIGYN